MKKFSVLVFSMTLAFTPVASAAQTTVGHNVRQYVQNRVSHYDRRSCAARHGHLIKRHHRLVCSR